MVSVDVYKGKYIETKAFISQKSRYILNRHDVTNLNSGQLSEQRLQRISMISFKSHKLKTERNPSKLVRFEWNTSTFTPI